MTCGAKSNLWSTAQQKILLDLSLSNESSFKKITQKSATNDFVKECIGVNANIVLKNFPYKFLEFTNETATLIIKKNKYLIEDIPLEYITLDMAREVVMLYPTLIDAIPLFLRCRDLYEIAIKNDGCILSKIPFEDRDVELCLLAIESSSYALEYVPTALKDENFWKKAILLNPEIENIYCKWS